VQKTLQQNGIEVTAGGGVQSALLAALLFGASTPLAKGLLADVSPQVLAGLLYLGSGVGLGVLWLWRRRTGKAGQAALTRRDLPWLAGAIGFGGFFGPLLLLIGLSHTPASATSLLLNLEGVFTALLAWIVFRENVDRRIALGMLAIVAGGALLAWQGRLEWGGLSGPLLIAAACLCWAIDNNLTQKISASDPLQIAALKGATAGTVNLAIGLLLRGSLPTPPGIGAALLLGFFGYGLSLVLFVLALRSLGTARTGAYFSTAPFVGAILSLLLWHEPVSVTFIVAGGLMALGVWLHLTERHVHDHTHESLSHAHAHTHDAHHQHCHAADDPPGDPHTHAHVHEALTHSHTHFPDVHHRHEHD
jgi:drug/metabolite transporter (DMT)-like permease